MAYKIQYYRQAILDAERLKRNEPKAYEKLKKLENELKEHPRTGTGKPEPLSGGHLWSRRITKKHRLVYEIHDTEVIVIVLTAYGHYDDK